MMVCDLCGKNAATVHLTEIVDDQISELHLCEQCAHKKSNQMEQQFGVADLLAGLAEFGKPGDTIEAAGVKCLNCGLSYQEFKKSGRLGCGECYPGFKKYLTVLLKKIHGSTQHAGKTPYKAAPRARKKINLTELHMKLQQAVEKEDFEQAAQLRDKIRELEKNEDK